MKRASIEATADELQVKSPNAAADVATEVEVLLRQRLALCADSLEGLTRWGPTTPEEAENKETLLYEYWALRRAIGIEK